MSKPKLPVLGQFTALHYRVHRHRERLKQLLEEGKTLPYDVAEIIDAMVDAHTNWDDELTAFYALELHTAISEHLCRSRAPQE